MAEIKKKKRARNFIGNGGEEETSSHCYSPEDSINTRRSVDISRGDKEEKKEKAKWKHNISSSQSSGFIHAKAQNKKEVKSSENNFLV